MNTQEKWEKLYKQVGDNINHSGWCDWFEGNLRCNCSVIAALDKAEPLILTALQTARDEERARIVAMIEKRDFSCEGRCERGHDISSDEMKEVIIAELTQNK